MVADSDHDSMSDDDDKISHFYIGDEDGFIASDSVCISDISLSDDGSDDCDDDDDDISSFWTDDACGCEDISVDESLEDIPIVAGSDESMPALEKVNVSDMKADNEVDGDSYWLMGNDCEHPSVNESHIGDKLKDANPELVTLDSSESAHDDDVTDTGREATDDNGDDDWFLDSDSVDESKNECTAGIGMLHWLLDRNRKRACQSFTPLSMACADLDTNFEDKTLCEQEEDGISTPDDVRECDKSEVVIEANDKDNGGARDNTLEVNDCERQDINDSPNETSYAIAEDAKPVNFEDVDEKDEEFRPKRFGETYGDALGKIFSEPSFLTSLLSIPFWPIMEYMEAIPD